MKYILMMIFISSTILTNSFGVERPYEDIKNIAVNWAVEHQRGTDFKIAKSNQNKPILFSQLDGGTGDDAYHIVKLEPKGWVIVSNDDIVKPILGYSFTSAINSNDMLPPEFVYWMKGIGKEIKQAKTNNLDNSYYKDEWSRLATDPKHFKKENILKNVLDAEVQVGPLLTTTWNQGEYYNNICPVDIDSAAGNDHVWVGCVATAMSQIMKYHVWPTTGVGSHTYTHSTYGELAADFTTTYNWSTMTDNVSSANSEVAKISYHAGVSVNMEYGPNGSGAGADSPDHAWKTYFKYRTIGAISKSDKTDSQWHTLLKTDLDNSMPIYYGGLVEGGSGGHAFVCDGYKYEDDSKVYHFNWGWGGYANGWFTIGALNPANTNYNSDNMAIFGVSPDRRESTVVLDVSDTVGEGAFKYYHVSAKSENTINTLLRNLSADMDLYIKVGSNPTTQSYDCKSWNMNTDEESCSITLNNDSDVYIGVHGYEGGSYNLKITVLGDLVATDTDGDGIPDSTDTDDDNDGISDIVEIANGLDPLNASDAQADFDGDGFSNAIEISVGTDIRNVNSKPIWTPVMMGDLVIFIPAAL